MDTGHHESPADEGKRRLATIGERYEVLGQVGRGGMATVYLATDLKHDRRVAIKVLDPEVGSLVGADRFLREINIVANLTHPHILPLHDSGKAGDHLYYVMPFVEGGSLAAHIKEAAPLPLDEALRLASEMADGLRTAHAEGIVHRDLKPENVLLLKGHAVLADFGVASMQGPEAAPELTGAGIVVGSPAYMSPEQVSGDPLDARTDLYSLGCVLFEMLSGQQAFEAKSNRATALAHLFKPVPTLAERGVDVPRDVEACVARCLAKDPADRFESADELYAMLVGHLRESSHRPRAWGGSPDSNTPNLGTLVSRMCDRWRQVNEFEAALRKGWQQRPGEPQIYIVSGGEGGAHGSLVERLVHTRIADFASSVAPDEAARVVRTDVPWPNGGDLHVSSRDLALSLFRELAPSYMGDDLSVGRLAELPSLSLAPVVVIEHDLWSRHWTPATTELLTWYAEQFWGDLPGRDDQLWLVFVKVIHEPMSKGLMGRILGPRRRRGIVQALDAASSSIRPAGRVTRLEELGLVTPEDVKDWFTKNRIYESEAERTRLADSLFGDLPHKPLAVVEAALTEIHQNFLAQQAI